MANMKYCRFENTFNDLLECKEALEDAGSLVDVEQNAGQYEKPYIRKLVILCKQIADEFGTELNINLSSKEKRELA